MQLFSHLSSISRQRKLMLLAKTVNPTPDDLVLDLGAEVDPAGDKALHFIDSCPWKGQITAVNISKDHVAAVRQYYPEIVAMQADARDLPFADKHFDVVYSNAVIEHVGTFEDQARMAREIMRVGRRWFVTTPNRWYPFEFHMRLPLVTWLPQSWCWGFGRIVSYNHVRRRYTFFNRGSSGTRLLTAREMQALFPNSRIVKQRVTWPFAETLIAIGGEV